MSDGTPRTKTCSKKLLAWANNWVGVVGSSTGKWPCASSSSSWFSMVAGAVSSGLTASFLLFALEWSGFFNGSVGVYANAESVAAAADRSTAAC